MRGSAGSVQGLDKVPHLVTRFPEVAERSKTSLVVGFERTEVCDRGGDANDTDSLGSELREKLAKGCCAHTAIEEVGLSYQDIHVHEVSGQVTQTGRRQLLPRGRLPADEANGPSLGDDQRLGGRRMLPDSGEGLFWIAPPTSDVGTAQPRGDDREVAAGIERGKTDIGHI